MSELAKEIRFDMLKAVVAGLLFWMITPDTHIGGWSNSTPLVIDVWCQPQQPCWDFVIDPDFEG